MAMYRPTIKSNLWLGLMTLIFLTLYYWSESSKVEVQTSHYAEKLEAAQTMHKAMEVLKNVRLPQLDQGLNTGGIADPIIYTMLGEKDSPITTDEGRIEDKITSLNPNFAAAAVDMLTQTGVQAGDTIAVLLTGSLPGANLAVFSAINALKLNPVVITSVGSSWWGANSPEFTWLDMEKILENEGIFRYRSIAASIGGADDHGGLRLSDQGRELIINAIDRNEVTLIHQGSLSQNIQARLELFKRVTQLSSFKTVVNVGGGTAAIGHRRNAQLISTGVHRQLPVMNYPNLGSIHYLAEAGVPVVMIGKVQEVAHKYDLPIAQLTLPQAGKGRVFEIQRYNFVIASFALFLMLMILVIIKYLDNKSYEWSEQKTDADSII